MNTNELRTKVQEQLKESNPHITKKDVTIILQTLVDVIVQDIEQGGSVRVAKLGVFKKIERQPRQARNPKTGETINVPGKHVAKFNVARSLKQKLNS